MHRPILMLVILLTLCTHGFAAVKTNYPLGKPANSAEYSLAGNISDRPEFERKNDLSVIKAVFTIGKTEKFKNKTYQWYSIGFTRANGDRYAAWFLMDRLPNKAVVPDVARYVWYEAGWPDAIEYVNAVTDKAELPRLSLWKYGWPRLADNSAPAAIVPGKSAPAKIYFQGYQFNLSKNTSGRQMGPAKATVIKLRPDALVGLAGTDKDRLGRHKQSFPPGFQYEYDAPPSKEDVQADVDSGLNFFFNHKKAPDWLYRTECYVTETYAIWEDWPVNLYRSNFYGRGWHVDEPCVYLRGDMADKKELANKITPAETAKLLEEMTKTKYNTHYGQYSRDTIESNIKGNFGLGNLKILDAPYPVWEVFYETSWYELAGQDFPGALVDEDINQEIMVNKINMAFGTNIPALLENACEIRIAIARGAARNFGKEWGTSNYAYMLPQLNPQPDMASWKYMYDAGATMFWQWFGWVGLTDAQVPYSYKRFHAEAMKKYIAMNPKRDLKKLRFAADTCIVLPYGYTFSTDRMFKVKWLPLDRKNAFGLTYRQVLANAAAEMEKLLRNAVKFDIAVDEPRFTKKGYKQLIYVRENGKVDVYRGAKISSYTGPIDVKSMQADLGPEPTVNIDANISNSGSRKTISVKISAQPGTGELAKNIYFSTPTLIWTDVLMPDGDNMITDAPEFDISCETSGVYMIRASSSDCFGRPAITVKEIKID